MHYLYTSDLLGRSELHRLDPVIRQRLGSEAVQRRGGGGAPLQGAAMASRTLFRYCAQVSHVLVNDTQCEAVMGTQGEIRPGGAL